jgi:hypothetical protein
MLRWLKTVVVSVQGEGVLDASGGDQEDVPEALVGCARWACAVEASISRSVGIEIEGSELFLEMSLAGARVLARWCPA